MAQMAEIRSTLPKRAQTVLNNFWGMALVFTGLMFLSRIVETILIFQSFVLDFTFWDIIFIGLYEDLCWLLYFFGLLLILYFFVILLSVELSKLLLMLVLTVSLIIHAALILYFMNALLPLGKDLFAYSTDDLLFIASASGRLGAVNLSIGAVFTVALVALFYFGNRFFRFALKTCFFLTALLYVGLISVTLLPRVINIDGSETKLNIERNKSRFLSEEAFNYLMYGGEFYFDFYLRGTNEDLLVQKEYTDDEFPFLHTNSYPDVLSPFFDSLNQAPNLVFISFESLGRAYSGTDAELGSFTPFLDSLERHSLVWTNALSSTGRTFGVLPGLFGGLPFGDKGFMELYKEFPSHQTLLSILSDNGYENRFFIGSDKNFDFVADFLNRQNVIQLEDETTFPLEYKKAPSTNENFTWGYADKDLFRNALTRLPKQTTAPQVTIFLTQSSHSPYLIPELELYEKKLLEHLTLTLKFNEEKIKERLAYKNIYQTILYADDAVKLFFEEYKKRPEFSNTIFIITGDHRLTEIPMSTRLDRFHVPLIIYSPMLRRRGVFKGVTSHFEITPTLLAMLEKQKLVSLPQEVIWQGQVLDTARTFQSHIAMPLMRNKNQLVDYIHGEFFLSEGEVFLLRDGLELELQDDINVQNKLNGEFEDFKNKNSYMVQTGKLLPPNR